MQRRVKLPLVDCSRGAPMGRPNVFAPSDRPIMVRVMRLPLDAGGYDSGGAYWGKGTPDLWIAYAPRFTFLHLFRAHCMTDALRVLLHEFHGRAELRFTRDTLDEYCRNAAAMAEAQGRTGLAVSFTILPKVTYLRSGERREEHTIRNLSGAIVTECASIRQHVPSGIVTVFVDKDGRVLPLNLGMHRRLLPCMTTIDDLVERASQLASGAQ